MANITVSTSWVGQWAEKIAIKAISKQRSIPEFFYIADGIKGDVAYIPLMEYNGVPQQGDLCGAAAANNLTISDKRIDVYPYHIKQETCKTALINTNFSKLMKKGTMVTEIPQEVLEPYIKRAVDGNLWGVEDLVWNGTTATNNFSGILEQLDAAAGTIRPTFVAGNLVDPATVIDELNKITDAAAAVTGIYGNIQLNPDFKILISPQVFAAYQRAMSTNQATATIITSQAGEVALLRQSNPMYVGRLGGYGAPLYVVNALVGEVAVAGCFTNEETSPLVLATDLLSDLDNIYLEDRSLVFPSDTTIAFSWLYRMGCTVTYPSQVVLLKA